MNLKLLRSTLCLLAISAPFMDGAMAQPSGTPSCVDHIQKNLNASLISVRLSDQGSTLVAVNTNTKGNVTECSVVKDSGSESLDRASCDWVKDHWRSLDRCQAF
jgi:hypothetical protein